MTETSTTDAKKSGDWRISLALSVVILLVAGGLAAWTFFTEPTAEKAGASKTTAMLVDVVEAERGNYSPQIVAQGTVEPAKEIVLRPQVGGRVISLGSGFTPGGFVEEGELMFRIQPEDYRHTLAQRRSDLQQAKSDLTIERGRHDAATAEYDRFGEKLSEDNEALVLRTPQMEAAEQQVEAARAAVDQAKLDLSRTTVEAPFDAHVLTREINVGSQVSPDQNTARLVGSEAYWVGVELPLSKLRWVQIAGEDEGDRGSEVRVRNRQAWPEETFRRGHLFKKIGALDEGTRMARVLAKIPDPLAREADDQETPALTIEEFVEVTIDGETIEDVVRLDRDYVRQDETVWVMEEGELQINELEIVVWDEEYAYVSDGLEEGAQVVTTNLSTVVEGEPLRLSGSGDEEASDE